MYESGRDLEHMVKHDSMKPDSQLTITPEPKYFAKLQQIRSEVIRNKSKIDILEYTFRYVKPRRSSSKDRK